MKVKDFYVNILNAQSVRYAVDGDTIIIKLGGTFTAEYFSQLLNLRNTGFYTETKDAKLYIYTY